MTSEKEEMKTQEKQSQKLKNSKILKRNKQEKGITLIALVVTIVVLLILAGISITVLFGENGIIKTAKEAGVETRGSVVEEAKEMWKTEQNMSKYTNKKAKELSELLDELLNSKQITEEEKKEIEETGKVTIGSRVIEFGKQEDVFMGYYLKIDYEMQNLGINFIEDEIEMFIAEKKDNTIDRLTEEELVAFMFNLDEGGNKTFEQLMEELFNAGEIDKKYTTAKEYYFDTTPDITEENYKEGIYEMRRRLKRKNLGDIGTIEIITPEGNSLNTEWGYYKEYQIPVEPRDVEFTIKYESEEYKLNIHIGDYVIAAMYNSFDSCALDVKNKKYLTIQSAKVAVNGLTIDIDSKHLVQKEGFNVLEGFYLRNELAETSNISTRETMVTSYWTIFNCEEGVIEGYARYLGD